jgi:hypothetical protein
MQIVHEAKIGTQAAFAAFVDPGFASRPTVYLPWLAATALSRVTPIPPFGNLGVDPTRGFLLPPMVVPAPSGSVLVSLPVPNDPGLRGARLWLQAFIAPDQRLSNVTSILLR